MSLKFLYRGKMPGPSCTGSHFLPPSVFCVPLIFRGPDDRGVNTAALVANLQPSTSYDFRIRAIIGAVHACAFSSAFAGFSCLSIRFPRADVSGTSAWSIISSLTTSKKEASSNPAQSFPPTTSTLSPTAGVPRTKIPTQSNTLPPTDMDSSCKARCAVSACHDVLTVVPLCTFG